MKKIALLFSATILFASLTFAQTPQTQDKSKDAPKKEASKDSKDNCDPKTKAACSKSKDPKGCCAHGDKKSGSETKAPEKK